MDDLDPSFRVWILAKRQTIHERLMRSLDAALTSPNISGETRRQVAAAVANLDPTHEQACCCLMQAHAEDGDTAGALRIYKALWELLDRDYGMEPSKATQDLVARIKLGAFERPAADHRVRSEDVDPAVVSISQSATDGATPACGEIAGQTAASAEAVRRCTASTAIAPISCKVLACILRPRWFVFANGASSTARLRRSRFYGGHGAAIRSRNHRLSGRRRNQLVMVLRDENTGDLIWSESLRLGLDNWFGTQQRVIRRIATSLNVQLSAERTRRLAGEPDVSLDVYDRWLRGQSLMTKFDPESWRRAVAIFIDAIREDPSFSPSSAASFR